MTDPSIRTVLLAREGAARDRLVEALVEAGADVVQTIDPLQGEPATIEALAPDALVVALEPAVEDALDAFETVLTDAGRMVIFEESALVLERSGWDAARWVRHLAAKLHGQRSVLPPGTEESDDEADASPAQNTIAGSASHDDQALSLEPLAPSGSDAFDQVAAAFDDAVDDPLPDRDTLNAAASSDDAGLSLEPLTPLGADAFDPVAAEFDGPLDDASATVAPVVLDASPQPLTTDGLELEDAPQFPDDAGLSLEPVSASDTYAFDPVAAEFDGPLDASASSETVAPLVLDTHAQTFEHTEVAANYAFDPVAAEFDGDADDTPVQAPTLDFDFELVDVDGTDAVTPVADAEAQAILDSAPYAQDAPGSVLPATADATDASDERDSGRSDAATQRDPGELDGSTLQLLDTDALPPVASAAAPEPARGALDLADLEHRISGLSLADTDSYGHGPRRGVVLVEGGLGGPDAVRQLLGSIPEGFPRPILIRLQLDGGRYDRLVRQMERATPLPVQLAEAGMSVVPGEVYFLPPGLLPAMAGGELRFADNGDLATLPDAVPADDSAVLFLSGADASLVDVAMGPSWQGALVGGQSDEGCYDSVAAHAVAQRGGPSGLPSEIADWLLARWMPAARQSEPGPGGLSL